MKLRPARPDDCYPLWLWANDPSTRAASGGRAVIAWADHCRWFVARTGSPSAVLLTAESADSQPVGSVRFESGDGWATAVLSYVVAPEARGRGFGRALLVEGMKALRARYPEVRVEALVQGDNPKSRRLFAMLGWNERTLEDGRSVFTDTAEAAV